MEFMVAFYFPIVIYLGCVWNTTLCFALLHIKDLTTCNVANGFANHLSQLNCSVCHLLALCLGTIQRVVSSSFFSWYIFVFTSKSLLHKLCFFFFGVLAFLFPTKSPYTKVGKITNPKCVQNTEIRVAWFWGKKVTTSRTTSHGININICLDAFTTYLWWTYTPRNSVTHRMLPLPTVDTSSSSFSRLDP